MRGSDVVSVSVWRTSFGLEVGDFGDEEGKRRRFLGGLEIVFTR